MREWRDIRLYFRALSDVRRLRIVAELAKTPEMSVKDLGLRLRASQPLVSWHLRVLVRCGLVKTRRQGRLVFCSLNRSTFTEYQNKLVTLLDDGVHEEDAALRDDHARLTVQPPPLGAQP